MERKTVLSNQGQGVKREAKKSGKEGRDLENNKEGTEREG